MLVHGADGRHDVAVDVEQKVEHGAIAVDLLCVVVVVVFWGVKSKKGLQQWRQRKRATRKHTNTP